MGPLLVTLESLLVLVVYGKAAQADCPIGCTCSPSFINCCESERFLESPIKGSDDVTGLRLSGCPPLLIARQNIWTLRSLEDVTITRTPVSYLHAFAFRDLPKLKNLVLNELNLSVRNTHPSAFTDLPIQQLDLKNNDFKTIHSQMFSGLRNLQSLDLSRNQIIVIHNQAFRSLAALSTLNLNYNNLSAVTPLWFRPSSNYSSLRISILGNNLTNECRFRGFDLPENGWFKRSLWPNDSVSTVTANLPECSLPFFTNNYHEIYVKESSPVTVACSAQGTPKPTLTWMLPSGSEVLTTTSIINEKLHLSRAELSDAGIYACVASNSEGSSVALTKLSVIANTTTTTTTITSTTTNTTTTNTTTITNTTTTTTNTTNTTITTNTTTTTTTNTTTNTTNSTTAMIQDLMVTDVPKKKASFTLLVVFIILLSLVLVFVIGYIVRLIYRLAKKPSEDDFEFSRFVDMPNILPVPENPQPMPHV